MGKLSALRGIAKGADIDGTGRRERADVEAEIAALKHDIERAQRPGYCQTERRKKARSRSTGP